MKDQRICIIGSGLAGLTTAVALSKLNLKIDVIAKNIEEDLNSCRTIAISQSNYEYIKKLNIFKFPKKAFWPCTEMKLYAKDKKNLFSKIFELKNKNNKKIFYMIQNSILKKNIIKYIKKNKSIKLKKNNVVQNLTSLDLLKAVKFKKNISKYNLIIICTGANSMLVKNIFKDEVYRKSYDELSGTTIVTHEAIHNNIARQIFLDDEILALLPISNTQTSIVWSVKKDKMKDYRLKNNELFKKKIQFYTKKYIKKIKQFERIEFKELNLLIRKKYYKERVLLFGDALHIVHPFVGQGFNMVIRDLKNLNEILGQKINLGLDIGSIDILGEFSSKTKSRNFIYSLGIDFIKDLFSKNLIANDFRNKIMTMINRNNSTKDMFFNLADKGFRF